MPYVAKKKSKRSGKFAAPASFFHADDPGFFEEKSGTRLLRGAMAAEDFMMLNLPKAVRDLVKRAQMIPGTNVILTSKGVEIEWRHPKGKAKSKSKSKSKSGSKSGHKPEKYRRVGDMMILERLFKR